MYCRNCGKKLEGAPDICAGCGARVADGRSFCPSCGAETNTMAVVCLKCGVSLVVEEKGVKSRLAAGLLGILLGEFGVHRFYLGFVGIGILQIVVTFLTCGVGGIWGFIEGVLILTGVMDTDAQGRPLKKDV